MSFLCVFLGCVLRLITHRSCSTLETVYNLLHVSIVSKIHFRFAVNWFEIVGKYKIAHFRPENGRYEWLQDFIQRRTFQRNFVELTAQLMRDYKKETLQRKNPGKAAVQGEFFSTALEKLAGIHTHTIRGGIVEISA